MATSKVIQVPPIVIGNTNITIVGTAPLLVQKFSEKAQREFEAMVMQTETDKLRQPKNPIEDFEMAAYTFPDTEVQIVEDDPKNIYMTGEFGFPAVGLKQAIVRAATDAGMNMTDIRRMIRIPCELLKIDCVPGPYMRRDYVRNTNGRIDLRYRPCFREWSITTLIQHNKSVLTLVQLLNLIRIAGFGVGLGEWRPSGKTSTGIYGTFNLTPNVENLPDEEYGGK